MSLLVKLYNTAEFLFYSFFLTNGGESVLKVLVRAAHGRPAVSSNLHFLLLDYLYQHPTIFMKTFVGLDIFVRVAHKSRGENINDG